MKNKHGYPQAVVRAIENDPYTRGDSEFSATSLIEPPRKQALREKFKKEVEEEVDVDDRIFILYGQLGHLLLERAGRGLGKSHVVEERFFGEIDGVKISAQIDSLDLEEDGTLVDYKFTTVYGFHKHDKRGKEIKPKSDWIKQMNIQLELLRQNGLDAKRLKIWGMLRDWRPAEWRKDPGIYPLKLGFHDIPMAPRERTRVYISKQISAHRLAKKELPLCSDEDRWATKYDAFNRCHSYCEVNKFCTQYKEKIRVTEQCKEG